MDHKKKLLASAVSTLVLLLALGLNACGQGGQEGSTSGPLPTATPYDTLESWNEAQQDGVIDTLDDAVIATAAPETAEPTEPTAAPTNTPAPTEAPAAAPTAVPDHTPDPAKPTPTPVPSPIPEDYRGPIELPMVPIG